MLVNSIFLFFVTAVLSNPIPTLDISLTDDTTVAPVVLPYVSTYDPSPEGYAINYKLCMDKPDGNDTTCACFAKTFQDKDFRAFYDGLQYLKSQGRITLPPSTITIDGGATIGKREESDDLVTSITIQFDQFVAERK